MVIEIVGGSVAEDGRSMARDYRGDQDFMRIIEILLLRRWDLEENQESGKYVI
jgi:hypothetical protein